MARRLLWAGALAGVAGFLRAPPRRAAVARKVLEEAPAAVDAGLHGSQSCFLPLDQMDANVMWPRILRVAGAYPGIKAAEIAATPAAPPAPENGFWTYDFPDAHGAEFGVVAMPGNDLVNYAADPIALVASSTSLGLLIPETEVLVVIDRGETYYDARKFFAYAYGEDVYLRRMDGGYGDDAPEGWRVLGRVVLVKLPYDPATMHKTGTWMEEDEN
mmetsp:Transcript_27069/g.81168  ORF Transcript_27069/g.81168 Transcript_27069/m.81168 type:complete len:216 (+) Transcript_27069:223-870(+)